jgi:hypothetical protein
MPSNLSQKGAEPILLPISPLEADASAVDSVFGDPPSSVASWVDSPSGDPPCPESAAVGSLYRGLVRSEPASADWLTSLSCDPEGCEPVSLEHPTARRKAHPIEEDPNDSNQPCLANHGAQLPFACVRCYLHFKACHTTRPTASPFGLTRPRA